MLKARAQKKWRAAKRRRLTATPLPHGSSVRSKPCAPSKSSPALEGRDNRHACPSSASRTSNDPPQIHEKRNVDRIIPLRRWRLFPRQIWWT